MKTLGVLPTREHARFTLKLRKHAFLEKRRVNPLGETRVFYYLENARVVPDPYLEPGLFVSLSRRGS